MQAFVHEGRSITVQANHEINGGDGVLIGSLFGVAKSWSAAGETVEIATNGVFQLRKPAEEHWQVGDRIYWNSFRHMATNVEGDGPAIGVAIEDTRADHLETGQVHISGLAI